MRRCCGHGSKSRSCGAGSRCDCDPNGANGGAGGGRSAEIGSLGEGPLMAAVVALKGSAARERTGDCGVMR
jgi:hypothetical protein